MNNRTLTVALFCLFLAPLSVHAFDDGDLQYWNTSTIVGTLVAPEIDLLGSVTARVQGKWRWGDDLGRFYYQQIDAGSSFNQLMAPWFSVGLFYKHCWQRAVFDTGVTWYEERRPYITGTATFHVSDWTISNRLQIERRFFDKALSGMEDAWRFRGKVSLTAPAIWTPLEITPYVSEEAFIDDLAGSINQNRLTAGLFLNRLTLPARLKADISVMWVATDAGADWQETFVIGTNLIVSFQ